MSVFQTAHSIDAGCVHKPSWVSSAAVSRLTTHSSDTGSSLHHFPVADAAADYFCWRRGVVVTELLVSTKLLYAEPG